MRRRRRMIIATAVAAALAGAAFLAWYADIYSGFYGGYICARCGADERIDRRAVLGVTYFTGTEINATPVSRLLTKRAKQPCAHEWHLDSRTRTWGTLLGWRGVGCGPWPFSTMDELAHDEGFARELGRMPDPQGVWQDLWKAELASEAETERVLGDWWWTKGRRRPFAQWWVQHGARIRELGRVQRSGDGR